MRTEGDIIQAFYRPAGDFHDEMQDGGGAIRPHWRAFADAFANLSAADLSRRWEFGQTLLQENGVTYNVYGDPAGLERPWQLDPLPVILSAAEWSDIERAVVQRATLLDAVIGDLYGARRLIADGLIPPSLLHANPNYLRPCAGMRPPGGHFLNVYAVELARGNDGGWRVIADRTEVPAGTGYALENRTIVSRVLPEFFRAMPVRRLGPFFDALRATLQSLSPRRNDDPRIVLMTPGPYNETYFEHAFLARHLGLTLVQGEDLTVRDNKVFLKTLTGLQQVDVIRRRTMGEWCDPLELRGDFSVVRDDDEHINAL
ncbi:MAG TPA: circularly permuted type 2 ATP-grasp protein, partial [Magnetospirillum sp.]|nr:circularly permuted type 2 ATP-grasp protein [Magnetospirillum sp.]